MFSFFKKKKFTFNCPICNYKYSFNLDPNSITEDDYPHYNKHDHTLKIAIHDCQFCKHQMTVLMRKDKTVTAIDEKWTIISNEYDSKYQQIENEIMELEDYIEENPEDKENKKHKSKIKTLENIQKKLEDDFDKKDEKYQDKIDRWEGKLIDKM